MRIALLLLGVLIVLSPAGALAGDLALKHDLVLKTTATQDQDDSCIWVHPSDPALSTIIASDKAASLLLVYGLDGSLVQSVAVDGKPGNIDLRHGVRLGEKTADLIAYNDRDNQQIRVYKVEPETRQLIRVDDGQIGTGPNYGLTLYHSHKNGALYAFTVSEEDAEKASQFRLFANEEGKISGELVRSWKQGKSEGCTADDENGVLFIGEEARGVWRFGAEPDAPAQGELVLAVGENGITADVEGLALSYGPDGTGYLFVSSQGSNNYKVFRREAPHAYMSTFTVEGARETDGIDILNTPLGDRFPKGIFTLHNGTTKPCPTLVCSLAAFEGQLDLGIQDPRKRQAGR